MALLNSIQQFLGIGSDEPQKPDDKNVEKKEAQGSQEALIGIFEGLLQKLQTIDFRLESLQRIEAAVSGMTAMVQFVAKGSDKRDRDLRAHITSELDKLGATLRLDASKQGAVDLFKGVVPVLDDIDFVLRECGEEKESKGMASIALLQKKLKDAFAKFGVEEIVITPGETLFDSELHDGEPTKEAQEQAIAKGTIVSVSRAGYVANGVLLRAAEVRVQE